MENFSTPMMKQYKEIKAKYQDCLLFYRMGDFYELFMEDAYVGAHVLNITLTSKAGGKDGRIPMAGIPYHAVDSYLAKLVKAGYKVAICEQLSPPNKKGLVERDVIRIVTPGTMLDEKALEQKNNNYIVSIAIHDETIALATADLSTGFFQTTEFEGKQREVLLRDELSRLNPSECILPEDLYNNHEFLKQLKQQRNMNIYCFQSWDDFEGQGEKFLKNHFGLKTLASFGLEEKTTAIAASSALLGYLQTTQMSQVKHIQKILYYDQEKSMFLDKSTIINLELFSTIREHDTHGSLLSVLDNTQTAMGGRLLKEWLKKPLLEKDKILYRQDAVETFVHDNTQREMIREILGKVTDIERVLSRLSVHFGNARDLVNLKLTLQRVLDVKNALKNVDGELISDMQKHINTNVQKIIAIIDENISDEPPIELREGKLIKQGVDKELDRLRKIISHSRDFIQALEKEEREKTGINSLKIRYNQVFGFYIEVSKANINAVPKHYMRKQTLVNGERFITEELKKHEEIILTAEEKANELEYQLFEKILEKVLSYTSSIQNAAQAIATIDCITTFADISQSYQYIRPKLLYSGEMKITQGRHPVVERLLDREQQFVPNDVCLDNIAQSLILLTGPNMAGKSVFIRQVALIVLLNQIGCFVPAKSAYLSVVDRIFVRSGASDVITSGLSTFMVEMVETAHILHNATSNSLIIMDEIGRGTSTYDGISIAWAVAEYLVKHFSPSPKTLFATHYHELQALEKEYPKAIKNFHMAVADDQGEPIFLHTILPEGASHSFGVAVAKLAGIPENVVEKATEMLHSLEKREPQEQKVGIQENAIAEQQTIALHLLQRELEELDIATMTPLEAMNKLAELKDQLKLLQNDNKKFLDVD